MDLKTFINTAMPGVTKFTVPADNPNNHTHDLTLTAEQISTLKGGGMVTGVMTSNDGHSHTYTISCMA
jgi:hypothetical protein